MKVGQNRKASFHRRVSSNTTLSGIGAYTCDNTHARREGGGICHIKYYNHGKYGPNLYVLYIYIELRFGSSLK